jgi:hypothetical protein
VEFYDRGVGGEFQGYSRAGKEIPKDWLDEWIFGRKIKNNKIMKKQIRLLIVSIAIIGCIQQLNGQQSSFNKVIDSNQIVLMSYAAINSFDNNFIIVGQIDNNDAFIIKLDTLGNILWSKKHVYVEGYSSITQTHDSCYLLSGQMSDIFCAKIKQNGDTIWTKAIDFGDADRAIFAVETNDHGTALIGATTTCTWANSNMLVVKLDSLQNIEWSKRILGNGTPTMAHAMRQTPDNGYIITGLMMDEMLIARAFLMKLDAFGNIVWTKKYITGDYSFYVGIDIVNTKNGMLWYFGETEDTTVVLKVDYSGNVLWAKSFDIETFTYDVDAMPKIITNSDGGFTLIMGSDMDYNTILRIDSLGNPLWSKKVWLYRPQIISTSDNGLLITGSGTFAPSNNSGIGVIKLDYFGNNPDCVLPTVPIYDNISVNVYPAYFSSINKGVTIQIRPSISEFPLSIHNGCVENWADISENKFHNGIISIYPNPTTDIINVECPERQEFNLSVFNILGVCVQQRVCNSEKEEINISNLPTGLYILELSGTNWSMQKKIIKE